MLKWVSRHILPISLVVFLIGLLFTIVSVFGVFYEDETPDFLVGLVDAFGDWNLWALILGPILLIGGGWYLFDSIKMRREFEELVSTPSKAKFIRNMERIEYLAWKLSIAHQERVVERKKEFRIKK